MHMYRGNVITGLLFSPSSSTMCLHTHLLLFGTFINIDDIIYYIIYVDFLGRTVQSCMYIYICYNTVRNYSRVTVSWRNSFFWNNFGGITKCCRSGRVYPFSGICWDVRDPSDLVPTTEAPLSIFQLEGLGRIDYDSQGLEDAGHLGYGT